MTAPTTNLIDITRHISVFSPDKFGKRRVDVIGADAVGSHVTVALAMLGIDGINVWDPKRVDEKDVANGAYNRSDIGKYRVEALKELVCRKTGCDIVTGRSESPVAGQMFGDIVFLATDTPESRKAIWQKSIRNKIRTKLMIEPRLGAGEARINVVHPTKPTQARAWDSTADAIDLTNWSNISSPSAQLLAGLSVWQMMRWAAIEAGHTDALEGELIVPLTFGSNEVALQGFNQKRVDIIGAGATGSHVVMLLAILGFTNIHVWDFDRVEAHNLANQSFMKADIGKLKVEAVKDLVKAKQEAGGGALASIKGLFAPKGKEEVSVTVHNERVDGTQELGEIIFLLTDTMASRKEIWEKGIRGKDRTQLMIETRMGVDEGRVYAVEPGLESNVRRWEGTLYEDRVAEASACGASISVGPTAMFLASFATWQMLRWINKQNGGSDKLDNEIIFTFRPLCFVPAKFK